MDIFILKYIYKLDWIFSERGETKYALDDLPALTEIPQTIDSGFEESLSESLIDQGPYFYHSFGRNRFEAGNKFSKYSS